MTMIENPNKFGFIGLGIMGTGMATNLLKGGRDLVVWNRTPEKVDALQRIAKEVKASGKIEIAESPSELVQSVETTFSMLSTPAAARDVFYSSSGVLEGISPGKAIVDCATLTAEDMIEFSSKVSEKGGHFLEAPVSGSKAPAEAGQLIFLAAGQQVLYELVKPELDLMGKASFFHGEVGNGTRMKLVVNMIMGTMLTSLAEGMDLAKASNLSQTDLLEILGLGAMANPMFKLKGPQMIKQEYPTAFPLKHAQKDMKFALELGEQLNKPLPLAFTANAAYEEVLSKYGDDDFAAVYEAVLNQNIPDEDKKAA
eukprot:CAMPEP_0117752648 /NCGR_PEP_ID=MMETSP0947-20121206/11743_1 /TAXON_ID=44440 /ORGANISM="Chattonella subsalsa, Strain CCMP2191" /LENGTH=311 /DNA_ID=CAMNT_0005571355 /DNA_START=184 /DNA_END=1119 /DNA_ORIENTATION=-